MVLDTIAVAGGPERAATDVKVAAAVSLVSPMSMASESGAAPPAPPAQETEIESHFESRDAGAATPCDSIANYANDLAGSGSFAGRLSKSASRDSAAASAVAPMVVDVVVPVEEAEADAGEPEAREGPPPAEEPAAVTETPAKEASVAEPAVPEASILSASEEASPAPLEQSTSQISHATDVTTDTIPPPPSLASPPSGTVEGSDENKLTVSQNSAIAVERSRSEASNASVEVVAEDIAAVERAASKEVTAEVANEKTEEIVEEPSVAPKEDENGAMESPTEEIVEETREKPNVVAGSGDVVEGGKKKRFGLNSKKLALSTSSISKRNISKLPLPKSKGVSMKKLAGLGKKLKSTHTAKEVKPKEDAAKEAKVEEAKAEEKETEEDKAPEETPTDTPKETMGTPEEAPRAEEIKEEHTATAEIKEDPEAKDVSTAEANDSVSPDKVTNDEETEMANTKSDEVKSSTPEESAPSQIHQAKKWLGSLFNKKNDNAEPTETKETPERDNAVQESATEVVAPTDAAQANTATELKDAPSQESTPSIIDAMYAKAETYLGDLTNTCGPMCNDPSSQKEDNKTAEDIMAEDAKKQAETAEATALALGASPEANDADEGSAKLDIDTSVPSKEEPQDILTPLSVATERVASSVDAVKTNESFQSIVTNVKGATARAGDAAVLAAKGATACREQEDSKLYGESMYSGDVIIGEMTAEQKLDHAAEMAKKALDNQRDVPPAAQAATEKKEGNKDVPKGSGRLFRRVKQASSSSSNPLKAFMSKLAPVTTSPAPPASQSLQQKSSSTSPRAGLSNLKRTLSKMATIPATRSISVARQGSLLRFKSGLDKAAKQVQASSPKSKKVGQSVDEEELQKDFDFAATLDSQSLTMQADEKLVVDKSVEGPSDKDVAQGTAEGTTQDAAQDATQDAGQDETAQDAAALAEIDPNVTAVEGNAPEGDVNVDVVKEVPTAGAELPLVIQ